MRIGHNSRSGGRFRRGETFVWITAYSLTALLFAVLAMLGVILINGVEALWPSRLVQYTLQDGTKVLGTIIQRQLNPETHIGRIQIKVANRDLYDNDFRWIDETSIRAADYPDNAVQLERAEYGNYVGYLAQYPISDSAHQANHAAFIEEWRHNAMQRRSLEHAKNQTASINSEIARLRNLEQKMRSHDYSPTEIAQIHQSIEALKLEEANQISEFREAEENLRKPHVRLCDASGTSHDIPLASILAIHYPNRMNLIEKGQYFIAKIAELFYAPPRESNTEGGLFPAIFGTIILVFLMSIVSFPLGVMAGVYLREYAKQGIIVRIVRIAVNNLAGIPSIVYGIFGLGFFVYGMGGYIDRCFFPDQLPAPTFGTGGILWASMTLGLLTAPVVIVSTEEAIGAIPRGLREGSLALGATQFQTLYRIVLPMASPGIMTGFILAMARAAGEVAPLMLTGVVKTAPALPLDVTFPFIHPERKFMHLGFHIFDIGFQSPNVEAAKPMVFVTALLLLIIVLVLSSVAIYLRNIMHRRYSISSI